MNVFSASFVRADAMFHDSYFFPETLSDVGKPWVGSHVAHRFQAGTIKFSCPAASSSPCTITGLPLLLLAVDVVGVVVNGSRRWLYVLGISLQPSEVAKVVEVMLAASFLGKRMMENKPIRLDKYVSAKAFLFVLGVYGAADF
jgi:cell division protein FtsW